MPGVYHRVPMTLPNGNGNLRLLYTDLDGTLLGPGGSLFASADAGVTARAADALFRVHEAGVELVLVSGRTREQIHEVARVLGAYSFVAETGALIVERGIAGEADSVVRNFGAFDGSGTPFDEMARSGAGGFLLEHYRGLLEPHTPWSSVPREATMLFRGNLEVADARAALERAQYDWLDVVDNGVIPRNFPGLDVEEVHAYHLVPKGVSKASGVRMHLQARANGIDPTEAAAVGDSPSDLELAREVGAMFLVANARPTVGDAIASFANARFTHSPNGDGFAEAVEMLLG